MIAIAAAVNGNHVAGPLAAVARLMARQTVSIARVFLCWALIDAEFSVFHVGTFKAVIRIRSVTRAFALNMAVTAVLLINLINTGKAEIRKRIGLVNIICLTFQHCCS